MTHMHETHERTGATEKEIEAAVVAYLSDLVGGEDGIQESVLNAMKALFTNARRYLVPPGTVIVPEAVLTAARAVVAEYEDPTLPEATRDDDIYYQIGGLLLEPLKDALAAMGGER